MPQRTIGYVEYVYDVFKEHHSSMGLDAEEIQDLIEENTFDTIEKWLIRNRYDLSEYYLDKE